jgi:hypothetical protein
MRLPFSEENKSSFLIRTGHHLSIFMITDNTVHTYIALGKLLIDISWTDVCFVLFVCHNEKV